MEAPTVEVSAEVAQLDSDDDLTDEQIQSLLKEAEARLRATTSPVNGGSASQAHIPRLHVDKAAEPYVQERKGIAIAEQGRLLNQQQRNLANHVRKVEDPVAVRKRKFEEKKATAGSDWYNLPKTDLTPELKRDLQLLNMRNVLDPHRHYKKMGKAGAPEYSQMGIVQEGPTEYYSARIQNKDRKQTFVEEVLAGERQSGRFKRKYADIQTSKTSGKKAFYKALKDKRAKNVKR